MYTRYYNSYATIIIIAFPIQIKIYLSIYLYTLKDLHIHARVSIDSPFSL